MTLYEIIDAHCKRKGISRAQLADRAGIPRSSLSMAFSRRSRIPVERLKRIAEVLDLPYKYLVLHSTDVELLLEDDEMQKVSDRLGLDQEAITQIVLHERSSYTLNWVLRSLEFWALLEQMSEMIECAGSDSAKNPRDWEYNCFLCHRAFAELLREARFELNESLSAEDNQAIEAAEDRRAIGDAEVRQAIEAAEDQRAIGDAEVRQAIEAAEDQRALEAADAGNEEE